jgi:tetratricopeptide (TPR) repeat protein
MILRAFTVVVCMLVGAGVARAHEQGKEGACAASAQQPAIASARESLQRTPDELKVRLGFVDLLIGAGCYDEAVHVLEDGARIHAGNQELATRLRTARSFINERQFFDGLDKAELEAKLSRQILRCTRFADIEACDQALAIKPDNVVVIVARGDALLQSQRPIEALDAYRRATTLDPSNAELAKKVSTAQSLRRTVEQRCMSADGESALGACQSVLAKGAANEFDLLRRIGVLQQAANQPAKALDTYIVANSLRRGDKAVALAIVALVESTGRSDGIALAARGSSLVALGRVREGIASMQRALALTPGLPGLVDQVVAAERLLRQEERMRESQPLVAATPTRTYSNLQPASRSN